MWSTEERNGTKFIWKIENFSCMKEEMLQSPAFSSHSRTWYVKISTSLLSGTEVINIVLIQHSDSSETLHFSLSFLDSDGCPLNWKEKKNCTFYNQNKYLNGVTFDNFIEKNELLGSRKNIFLPNNTLTVQCLIWHAPRELVLPFKCFARTQIEPTAVAVKKTFIWRMENVSAFTAPQTRVEAFGRNFASLAMKLSFKTYDEELQVTFQPSLFRANLKVKISVLDVREKIIEFQNKEMQFYGKEEQTLQTYIKKTMLTVHNNLFLNRDTLSIQFTCTLSAKFTFHDMVNENEIFVHNPQQMVVPGPISEPSKCTDEPESNQPSELVPSDSILQALQDMYEESFLSDCILKIGFREYPVHRAILGARSRFFKALFTTNMKEKNANCVDIKDVDEDTLQRLLRFVYLDKIEEHMGWESVSKLYATADMYAFESLQRKCSAILISGLCVSSVLQVLKLGDMHQDQDLKSAAMDFISCNDSEIIGAQNWLIFEKENATLASETLRKLYLQKVCG